MISVLSVKSRLHHLNACRVKTNLTTMYHAGFEPYLYDIGVTLYRKQFVFDPNQHLFILSYRYIL